MCEWCEPNSHQPLSVPSPLPTPTLLQHLDARIRRKIKQNCCCIFMHFAGFVCKVSQQGRPKVTNHFSLWGRIWLISVWNKSSKRGRATTSAPCVYRVVDERLLNPSAPPQIFFCERLPWKLISHSATSQDFRNPVKDPIKDSWKILDWWNILEQSETKTRTQNVKGNEKQNHQTG